MTTIVIAVSEIQFQCKLRALKHHANVLLANNLDYDDGFFRSSHFTAFFLYALSANNIIVDYKAAQ